MNIAKIVRFLIVSILPVTASGGVLAFHDPLDPFHTWDTTTSSGPSFGFDHRGFFTTCFLGDDRSDVTTRTSRFEGGFISQTGTALCTTRFPDGSVEEGLWDMEFVLVVIAECIDSAEGDDSSTLRYSATCGQVATGQAAINGGLIYNLEASLANGLPPLSLCADPEFCRIDIFGPTSFDQCNSLFGGANSLLVNFSEFIRNADNCGGEFPEGLLIEPGVKTALYCHSADANPESAFFLSACDTSNPHTGSEVVGHEGLEPEMTISPESVQTNCGGDEGNLRVTLFGSPTFDVSQVSIPSLRLAGEPVSIKPNGQPFVRFANRGGSVDLVATFESCPIIAAFLAATPLNPDGSVTLTLTGSLLDGTPFIASADVRPLS